MAEYFVKYNTTTSAITGLIDSDRLAQLSENPSAYSQYIQDSVIVAVPEQLYTQLVDLLTVLRTRHLPPMSDDLLAEPNTFSAAQYAEARARMCSSQQHWCKECPFECRSLEFGHDCKRFELFDPDGAVAIVRDWAVREAGK